MLCVTVLDAKASVVVSSVAVNRVAYAVAWGVRSWFAGMSGYAVKLAPVGSTSKLLTTTLLPSPSRTHTHTHSHTHTHTHTPVSYTHLTLPTMAVV